MQRKLADEFALLAQYPDRLSECSTLMAVLQANDPGPAPTDRWRQNILQWLANGLNVSVVDLSYYFAVCGLDLSVCGVPGCPPWFRLTNDAIFWDTLLSEQESLRNTIEYCMREFDWSAVYIAAEMRVSYQLVRAAITRLGLRYRYVTHKPKRGTSAMMSNEPIDWNEVTEFRDRMGLSWDDVAIDRGYPPEVFRCMQRTRAGHRDEWFQIFQRCGSISEAAKYWSISVQAASYRARAVLWRDTRTEGPALRHASWRADLDREGSVARAADLWGVSYPAAYARAKYIGWSKNCNIKDERQGS